MSAAILNLPTIDKGASYDHVLYWRDSLNAAIDLTGCTARMQVRTDYLAATALLELSTSNGRIVITSNLGKIALTLTSTVTAALAGLGGLYDLEVTLANGSIRRLIQGSIAFSPEVTHD